MATANAPEIIFPNLGIEIQHLNRVAFTLFGVSIYWYGVFIALGFAAGLAIALREAKKTGQNPDHYIDYLLYNFIFIIIGARLYYVLFSWNEYKDNLMKIFAIRLGGLAIYGGIIAAVVAGIIYTKRKGISPFLFADTAAPGILIGQAIGRWGNFFNREAFGSYTDSPLAMGYLIETVRQRIPASLLETKISYMGMNYIQVHPTFLYESLWNMGVFVLIMCYKRHKKFDGEIICLYFLGYGLGRLWIEGLRTDQLLLGSFAVSQLLSLCFIAASVGLIIYGRRKWTWNKL